MLQLLTKALTDRRQVRFLYDDKIRTVEPHAVGFNKAGVPVMRGYQTDGESASSPRAWKLFTISKIEDLTISNVESGAPRPGYKAGDTAMVRIVAELPALEVV